MSRKEELLRRIEEMKRRERDRAKEETRSYDPRAMDSERMPFGCWVWIGILVAAAVVLIGRVIHGL